MFLPCATSIQTHAGASRREDMPHASSEEQRFWSSEMAATSPLWFIKQSVWRAERAGDWHLLKFRQFAPVCWQGEAYVSASVRRRCASVAESIFIWFFLSLNEKILLRVQNVVVLFSSVFSCDGGSHERMNSPSFPSVHTPHIPLDTVWCHILLDKPSHHLNHNLNKLILTTVGAWAGQTEFWTSALDCAVLPV